MKSKRSFWMLVTAAAVASCTGSPTRNPFPTPTPTSNPCDGSNADPKTRLFYAAECSNPITKLDLVADVPRVKLSLTFFSRVNSVDDICSVIDRPQLLNVCDDAEGAFMSLLLNLAEGRLEDCTCLKGTTPLTVGAAALAVDVLLANPGRTDLQCGEALALAAGINSRLLLGQCAKPSPTPTPSATPTPSGTPTPTPTATPTPTGSPTPTPTATPTPTPLPSLPAGCSKGGPVITVKPGDSIQAALDTRKNGSVILVMDGVYPGSVTIGGNNVTLVAQDTGGATIGGSVAMQFNNECLVGFHVTGDVSIDHNNDTVDGNTIDGGVTISKNNATVTSNKIAKGVAITGNNNVVTGNKIGGSISDSGHNNKTTGNF